ncbi:MAG: succinyl-CoA synthetase subunit beta [Pseudomonadota bacterium]
MIRAKRILAALAMAMGAGPLAASADTTAEAGIAAFAQNCFSPFLTAARAADVLPKGYDFYDLRPFRSSNPISEPKGRPATPGTDRRCEVTVPGRQVEAAKAAIAGALTREGITQDTAVPDSFATRPGATFVAARQLNPRRVAVVQVGTTQTTAGPATFLNVERLTPSVPSN